MKDKKEKLLFAASFLIFIVVGTTLIRSFEALGFETTTWKNGEEVGSYIALYSTLIGILFAGKSFLILTDFKKDVDFKAFNLGWWYLFCGSTGWVVLIYLGSLINIKPLMLEQILGATVTFVFVVLVYINYRSKADRINKNS